VGTASFTDPEVAGRLIDQLPGAMAEAGVSKLIDLVGSLHRTVREKPSLPESTRPNAEGD
jgi:hypothetical protein